MKNPLVEPNYIVLSTDGDQHQKFKDAYKILIKTKIGSLQTYKVDLIIDTVNDTKHLPDKTKIAILNILLAGILLFQLPNFLLGIIGQKQKLSGK